MDGSGLVDSVSGGYADPAQGLFGPAVPWAADKRVDVSGCAEAATAAQVESQTKGKVLCLAAYSNRAELPEAATIVQQAKVRLSSGHTGSESLSSRLVLARRPLIVVGSTNPATRRQLAELHTRVDIQGVTVSVDPAPAVETLRGLKDLSSSTAPRGRNPGLPPSAIKSSWLQPRPRCAAHNSPARLAASVTKAASSGLSGTGNETYAPRPPPTGRP